MRVKNFIMTILPSRYLPVQIQQKKQQEVLWHKFKVNNKDNKTMSMKSLT